MSKSESEVPLEGQNEYIGRMTQQIFSHCFDNGLVLLAEPMDWLESAAFSILLPAGCAYDPAEQLGLGNFLCEMTQRGAGNRSSRQFVEVLENLGVDRASGVSNIHSSYAGAMPAENLAEALEVHTDLLRRATLPEEQMGEALQVCLQEVRSVEDDLAQKVMQELRQLHYGDPWGRSCQGTEVSLATIDIQDVRQQYERTYRPGGSIISIAGNIDWPHVLSTVERLLGDWQPTTPTDPIERAPRTGYQHIPHDSSQTHVAIAYDSVPYGHPDYFQARGAVGVLSDGMSSRLFTEVRERRGLCYTVYASMHSTRDRGSVMCYAGTSTDRAQETLDVMLAELKRIADGIERAELDRLKARVKSSLIMQQESSRGRSASMASDWYYLNRVQTLDELSGIIDDLSCDTINKHLSENPPREFTIVTLGEKELEVPVAVS